MQTAWKPSTPEDQGIDSTYLVKMLEQIQAEKLAIDSLLIIRNGLLVLEMYRYPYTADTLHGIRSVTKSFTSALIGIALDQGKIHNIYQPALGYFPGIHIANLDEAKRKITLENLLTMSSGFDWPGGMMEEPIWTQWKMSADWVQFVLDRPLSDDPGKRFVYSTGASHLLTAILQKGVGMTADSYARTTLFAALGIEDWFWESDPQGVNKGGSGLWLRPLDMAKFGQLYLQQGQWEGRQIVPSAWVTTSTQEQIPAGGSWLSDGYGYHWWTDRRGYYMARGYGGQNITVIPEHNLIIVATSSRPAASAAGPETFLESHILPAIQSASPLTPNKTSVVEMQSIISNLGRTPDAQAPDLPPQAAMISGKIYALEPSDLGWTTAMLTFGANKDTMTATVDGVDLNIGLDNAFRPNEQAPVPEWIAPPGTKWLGRGHWTNATSFAIEFFLVGNVENYMITFQFNENRLTIAVTDLVSSTTITTKGQADD